MAFKIFRKNCCGLDVHKTWIYACIGITDTNGRIEYKRARFFPSQRDCKPLLVRGANTVIKSDKYLECKERYRRIKARRGHKKATIAVCRMLLAAIMTAWFCVSFFGTVLELQCFKLDHIKVFLTF